MKGPRTSMKPLRTALVSSGMFCLGGLFVPIAIVSANALRPADLNELTSASSYYLLDTYIRYRPEPLPMYSMAPDTIADDCGYKRADVFADNDDLLDDPAWSPYTGYFDLSLWVSSQFRDEIKTRRVEQLGRSFNRFQARFLNGCIKETLVAPICANRVRDILDMAGLSSAFSLTSSQARPKQTRRFKTVCTYLDGLVARRKGKLSMKVREPWPNY